MSGSFDTLQVLYIDDHIVAVSKPAGLLVHKTNIDYHERDNLVQTLSKQLGRQVYPIHRLDKPTSGILLLALDAGCAKLLCSQFENREVVKKYIAVARGYTHTHGSITSPVRDRDRPDKPKVSATTFYQTLATIELPYRVDRYSTTRYCLLEIGIATGKRHQIRQHMKHINHPLIGDTSYGKSAHNQLFAQIYSCRRLLLHAAGLKFTHPITNHPISLYDPLTEKSKATEQYLRVLHDERWKKTPTLDSTEWYFLSTSPSQANQGRSKKHQ